ncbi:hypothetical protein [Methylosoma difficile]
MKKAGVVTYIDSFVTFFFTGFAIDWAFQPTNILMVLNEPKYLFKSVHINILGSVKNSAPFYFFSVVAAMLADKTARLASGRFALVPTRISAGVAIHKKYPFH